MFGIANYLAPQRCAVVTAVIGSCCLLAAAGCQEQLSTSARQREVAKEYGGLPGLRASKHVHLADEFARIQSENGTPELLVAAHAGNGLDDGWQAAENESLWVDAGAQVVAIFVEEDVNTLDERAREFTPPGPFHYTAAQLDRAAAFGAYYDRERLLFADLLVSGQLDFRVDHSQGVLADTRFVEAARVYVRLESIVAAQRLAENRPAGALEPLDRMFSTVAALAAVWHMVPRLAAVHLRREALAVVEAIAQHPLTTDVELRQLYYLINRQLQDWPDDRQAWIGDRAMGMHTYELIRDGKLLSLLTYEEIGRYRKDGTLERMFDTAAGWIDEDEYFYLQSMRKTISGCEHPYYLRRAVIDEIQRDLVGKMESPQFPIIAARLLLADNLTDHRLLAEDRASCEAWATALAAAIGSVAPDYMTNPLTGEAYQLLRHTNSIAVWGAPAGSDRLAAVVKVRGAEREGELPPLDD